MMRRAATARATSIAAKVGTVVRGDLNGAFSGTRHSNDVAASADEASRAPAS
jgi:hypothetical protein